MPTNTSPYFQKEGAELDENKIPICVALQFITGLWFKYMTSVNPQTCHDGFPGGAVVKNPPANAGNTGSSPGLGRSHMWQSN